MPNSIRLCSVDGCERSADVRRLCKRHYKRAMRRGELAPLTPSPTCSADGCQRMIESQGLCVMHLWRVRQNGTTDLVIHNRDDRVIAGEMWEPAPSYPGVEASDCGRIRVAGIVRTAFVDGGRYERISVPGINGGTHVHVLVSDAFLGPRPDGLDVRHLDGNRRNNHPENLVYGTRQDNMLDKQFHGTDHHASMTHCKRGHKFTPENTYTIPTTGSRQCLACRKFLRSGTYTPPG